MSLEDGVTDNPRPDGDEDVKVQGRSELAPHAALQVAVDDTGLDPVHVEDPVAVDGVLVTGKQAHVPPVLHRQQVLLVALGQHEGEAVEGAWIVIKLLRLLAGGPEQPPLVRAVGVTGLDVDHPTFDVALRSIYTGPTPALDEASVVVKHPLLAPVAIIARVHLKIDEGSGAVDGVEAEARTVLDLASLLEVRPFLPDVAARTTAHRHLRASPHRCDGLHAEAVPALDVAPADLGGLLLGPCARCVRENAGGDPIPAVLLRLLARDQLSQEAHVGEPLDVAQLAPRPRHTAVLLLAELAALPAVGDPLYLAKVPEPPVVDVDLVRLALLVLVQGHAASQADL
mmetsp:Transcript_5855/g.17417  ORF Transcript_5855/g.17417 Transcript_5855/m.17417 type:complete len:342 (-) Transcript_5855:267-1292(-)